MRLIGLLTVCLLSMTGIRLGYDSRHEIASFVTAQINGLGDTPDAPQEVALADPSVNGTRRSADLLERGPLERSVVLPLTARDLSEETLIVALGTEQAAPRAPGGAVVEILPSSRLNLELSAPVTDPLDKLLLAGQPARFSWPDANVADQNTVLATAFDVTQRQSDVVFKVPADSGPGLSTDEIKQLASRLPARQTIEPIDTADLAAALGQRRVQDFASAAQWRMSFDAHALSGEPQAVEISLKYATAQTRNTPWLMAVFLNGRFLQGRLIEGSEGELQTQVTLPAAFLSRQNELTVTFRNRSATPDVPADGAPSVAELKMAQLVIPEDARVTPGTDLAGVLVNGANMQLPNALTLAEGQFALDTLKALTSIGVELNVPAERDPNAIPAEIAVLTPGALDAFLAARDRKDGEQLWIAYRAGNDAQTLVTQSLTVSSTLVADRFPKSVLIISGASQEDNS